MTAELRITISSWNPWFLWINAYVWVSCRIICGLQGSGSHGTSDQAAKIEQGEFRIVQRSEYWWCRVSNPLLLRSSVAACDCCIMVSYMCQVDDLPARCELFTESEKNQVRFTRMSLPPMQKGHLPAATSILRRQTHAFSTHIALLMPSLTSPPSAIT